MRDLLSHVDTWVPYTNKVKKLAPIKHNSSLSLLSTSPVLWTTKTPLRRVSVRKVCFTHPLCQLVSLSIILFSQLPTETPHYNLYWWYNLRLTTQVTGTRLVPLMGPSGNCKQPLRLTFDSVFLTVSIWCCIVEFSIRGSCICVMYWER